MLARIPAALAVAAVVLFVVASGAHIQTAEGGLVSEQCLNCICEGMSGCNTTAACSGEACGPFRITWAYWVDIGRPVYDDYDTPDEEGAYQRCITNIQCSIRSVQAYMAKFARDCNNDDVVDCDDFAAIHRLGPYGCKGKFDAAFENRYTTCKDLAKSSLSNPL